jgi:hypothetical protein
MRISMAARKSAATKAPARPALARKAAARKTGASKAATPPPRAKSLPAPAAPTLPPLVVAKTIKADAPKAPKAPKLHRKPVRDSFTMPEADFALIATLKARALAGKRETKKSELLRAGLHALAGLDSAGLVAALARLEPVKIGRPKKGH